MKKVLLTLQALVFLIHSNAQSPELWGITSQGGNQDYGAIFKINGDGSGFWKVHDFKVKNPGSSTYRLTLLLHEDWLYGISKYGGSGVGVLFKYHPINKRYISLHFFSGVEGSHPSGSLMLASNGKMYGVTAGGGSSDDGALYEFDPLTEQIKVKLNFSYTMGAVPNGQLIENGGYLYGVTDDGPFGYDGILYRFHLLNETFELLHSFEEDDGENPNCDLLSASNGKLYGTTLKGGTFDDGTIFSFDPSGNTFAVVHHFNASIDGFSCRGNLIELPNNKIVGTAYNGGTFSSGTLFEFDPANGIFNAWYKFGANPSFRNPGPFLKIHSDGWVYGTNYYGTPSVFRFYPDSTQPEQLVPFIPNDFNVPYPYPDGGFTDYGDGWLYSATGGGGVSLSGTLFRFNPVTFALEKLIDKNESVSIHPFGSLCVSQNGNLYGAGGQGMSSFFETFSADHPEPAHHQYALFEINPSNGNFKRLAPREPLAFDEYGTNSLNNVTDGQAYGISTGYSGAKVFRYNPANDSAEVFLTISKYDIGDVDGDLIQATNGNLYGLSTNGGYQSGNNAGIIFKIDPVNKTFEKVFDFVETVSGNAPGGSLLQASDGMLYGMTKNLGTYSNVEGTIFRYDISTDAFQKLYGFSDTLNGKYPTGNLIEGADGDLYGMTPEGGIFGKGVIFRFNKTTSQLTKLWDFYGDFTGGSPQGSLIKASNGRMYGMTLRGGLNDKGVIFSFDPDSFSYKVIENFTVNEKGALPYGNLVEYHGPASVIYAMPDTVACYGSDITLLAIATGGYLHHTWYHDGVKVGGNAKGFPISPVTYADSGKYWCVIYNDLDSVVSDTMHLAVIDSAVVTLSAIGSNALCPYDEPVELTGLPSGGIYSGSVVNGNFFDPSLYGGGNYPTYYTYSYGCILIDSLSFTVYELPEVEFSLPDDVFLCENDGMISLEALPAGGSFSGEGVTGSIFDPALAGIGIHLIHYTYTENCSISSYFTITVEDCTGTEEVSKVDFKTVPNPFSDLMKVIVPEEMQQEDSHFWLINQFGNTVQQGKISSPEFFIHRNQLAAGMYLLVIESDAKRVSKKVVIE